MMAAVHHSLEIHGTVTVALPRSTYRGRSRTSQEPEAAALGRAILPNCLHCTQPLRQAASGHTVSNAVDIASLCPRSGETPEALEQDRLRQRVPCPVGRRETQRTRWPRTHTAFIHGHSLRGRTLLLPLAKPSHPKYWSRAGKVESRRDGFPSPIMVAEAIWKFLPSEYGSTPRCAKRPVQAGSTSRVLDGDTTSHNFINRHYTGCGTRRGNTMASRRALPTVVDAAGCEAPVCMLFRSTRGNVADAFLVVCLGSGYVLLLLLLLSGANGSRIGFVENGHEIQKMAPFVLGKEVTMFTINDLYFLPQSTKARIEVV